jgi:threonine synthase
MDILISSNLERLICMSSSQEKTKELMESLSKDGKYTLDLTNGIIKGEYATEEETAEAIKDIYKKTGYVMDTHTAVAYASYEKYKKERNDNTPTVIVSTASPYKFTKDVLKSIDKKYADMEFFPLMKELEKISGVKIPEPIKGLENKPILHKNVIEKNEIKEFIKKQLIK